MENQHMKAALTQNRMRYYAQDTTSQQRAAFFHRFRAAARKQEPDIRQRVPRDERFSSLPLFRDNGR